MKRVYTLILFTLFVWANVASAQTLGDFNKNYTYKITYDDYFNPTLRMTIKNISSKTITSVEVTIFYSENLNDMFAPERNKITPVVILPHQSATIDISYDEKIGYSKACKFWISKVRFSDGTIVDRWK